MLLTQHIRMCTTCAGHRILSLTSGWLLQRLSEQAKTSFRASNPGAQSRTGRSGRHAGEPKAHKGLGGTIAGIFGGGKHSKKRE